jgi:WD40 repeat protein
LCFWDLGTRQLVSEFDPEKASSSASKEDDDDVKRRKVEETKGSAVASRGGRQRPSPVFSLAVSGDGNFLSCGRASGAISVLRLPRGDRSEWLGDVNAHRGISAAPVRAMSFDPGCRIVLSGGDDHHICLLDAAAWGKRAHRDSARLPQLERFSAHRGWVATWP